MQVRKPFDLLQRTFFTPPGEDEVPQYQPVTDSKGGRTLKKVGSYSQTDYVNSFKDSVLLENVLQKCMITGDNSLLNVSPGFYMDITGLPQDFGELQNSMVAARASYDNAPDDVRSQYPTYESYVDAMLSDPDSPDFSKIMSAFGVIPLTGQSPEGDHTGDSVQGGDSN